MAALGTGPGQLGEGAVPGGGTPGLGGGGRVNESCWPWEVPHMQGSDPPPSLRVTDQSGFVSRRTLPQFLPLKVRQWSGSVYHWLSVHPTRTLPRGCLADLGSLPAAGSWPPTPQPEPAWEACCQQLVLGPQREGERESRQAGVQGMGLREDLCWLSALSPVPPNPCSHPFSPWRVRDRPPGQHVGVSGRWAPGARHANPAPTPRLSVAPGGRWDGFGACVATRKVTISCSSGLCPVAPAD